MTGKTYRDLELGMVLVELWGVPFSAAIPTGQYKS